MDEKTVQLCKNGCPLQKTLDDGEERTAFVYLEHKDGQRIKTHVHVVPIYEGNEIIGAVETFTTDENKAQMNQHIEELKELAYYDQLTGLPNRRYIDNRLDRLIKSNSQSPFGVGIIDVDFFKMVNDTYGHDVGDGVIVDLANVLRSNIREADLAIRYGGEEFLIMLHNSTDDGALQVAKNIHQEFGKLRFDVGSGETLQKTISIGVAKFPTDGDTIWKCIKYADTALYEAKNTGRNKIVEFNENMIDQDKYEGSY